MIDKTRTFPIEILFLEAFVRRFPLLHARKAEFEKKLLRKRAGYKGELILDYYMAQIIEPDFTILQDLRIPHNGTHFQIDALLISPYFILVIDAKNYAGTVEFYPEFNQLIRTYNDVTEVFPDPILQTKLQASQLKHFLLKNQITPPPIEFLVAMSNQSGLIKNPTNNREVTQRVCRSSSISIKIPTFQAKYQTPLLSKKEIKKLSRILIKSHEPFIPDLASMNMPLDQMQNGVQCPACETIGMEWKDGNWVCNHCDALSNSAHIGALKDYFLIHGPKITNKQFREFVNIPFSHAAKRLLIKSGLEISGTNKGRAYHPGKDFFI